jgi:hypothetical protein
MSVYNIESIVWRSANGDTAWTYANTILAYEGKGCGTKCFNAWRTMIRTNRTIDTAEPFRIARLYRDGKLVESIGA